MREIILIRLAEIKTQSKGFPKEGFRWGSANFNLKHASEVEPTELSDKELMIFYERIIRAYYKQA